MKFPVPSRESVLRVMRMAGMAGYSTCINFISYFLFWTLNSY